MATLTKKFDSNGWTFNYDMLHKGGLVIGDVRHDNYNLAKEIRVVRVWINPDSKNESEVTSFELGTSAFYDITGSTTYKRASSFNSVAPFDVYTRDTSGGLKGIQAKFRSKHKVFGDDSDDDDDYLEIEQSYIFTKYGKSPAHEPGGILEAARIFPLIKFKYNGKKIKSIRFDYRMNYSLDLFYYLKTQKLDGDLDKKILDEAAIKELKDKRPNLAGIFRDSEGIPISTEHLPSIFSAAEKPCLYEIFGYGLKEGIPGDKIKYYTGTASNTFLVYVPEEAITTWDNIHMWGNYKNKKGLYVKKQPSTPGAFHSLHMHWRWGDLAADPDFAERFLVAAGSGRLSIAPIGSNQFRGLKVAMQDIGGPLLDPKIPNQTLKFAITRSADPVYEKSTDKTKTENKWAADLNPSEQVFEKLFFDPSTGKPLPRKIDGGEDLVTWFSALAKKEEEISFWDDDDEVKPFTGTFFIHGFYFAHEPELDSNPFSGTIDKTAPTLRLPPTPHRWTRYPKDYGAK
jgi:hypothetical protein